MKNQLIGQEIVPSTFAAVDTVNLTYKFIAITTSKLQVNYAIGPKRYAEHLQQIAGGYYQVDKNLSICLAAIYQVLDAPLMNSVVISVWLRSSWAPSLKPSIPSAS